MTPGGAPEQAPRHALGRTGIDVPHVGIGCAWLGRRGADFDEEIAFDTICTALDSGIRLVDTASIYLGGASERVVGDALRARPTIAREVVVQTKVRDRRDFAYSYDETLRSVETSLTRLGLARLPLVYIHDPPAALLATVVAPGGALMALRSLQTQGVVGHIGITGGLPATPRRTPRSGSSGSTRAASSALLGRPRRYDGRSLAP
jgi:D-threo-aldose 1-dehydrogenase